MRAFSQTPQHGANQTPPASTPPDTNASKQGSPAGPLAHAPGPHYEAVVREYYARGSKEVAERNHWRVFAFLLVGALTAAGLGFWQLIPLKSVETVLVSKASNGTAVAESASSDWKPDQTMMRAFASAWVGLVVEINIATWQRSIERATYQTTGMAGDQLRDFLNKPTNNPAILVKDAPSFVREYEPGTVNFVSDNVLLVRYKTTTRTTPGAEKVVASYAMTLTLQRNKAQSKNDALVNPTGLVVSTFSVSEEIK